MRSECDAVLVILPRNALVTAVPEGARPATCTEVASRPLRAIASMRRRGQPEAMTWWRETTYRGAANAASQ